MISFFVSGTPEPAGSPKIVRHGTKPFIIWQKGPKWQKAVAKEAANHFDEPLDVPLEVLLDFYLTRPAKPKFDVPAVVPDLDKLVRSTLDGMNKVAYVDDSRVISLHATKSYEDDRGTGVRVIIAEVGL